MSERKKQSLLNGALVLAVAGILVKITGIIFKIYVTQKIGYDARGYFATAYNIYTPIYSLALAGFPTAVARIVAQKATEGKYRDVKKLFSVSLGIFTLLGAIGLLIIVLMAYPYALSTGSINAIPAILAVAPSVLFCAIISGYKGYTQGLGNMTPTSVSQVVESAGKLIFGFILMNAVLLGGVEFADKIPVINELVTDASSAYAAAAAISGVTIGSVVALVYMAVKHKYDKSSLPSELIESSPEATDTKTLKKQLINLAIPFAISSLVFNLTTFIDGWTIQNRLMAVLETNFDTVADMFPAIIAAKGYTPLDAADFKSYLFGAYDTVLEIKNIIPTFTLAFGISSLHLITEAWTRKNMERAGHLIHNVIKFILLLSLPAGLGMMALSEDLLVLIYGNNASTAPAIPYIAPILMAYGISVCFLTLSQPITNILQGIEQVTVPIKSMAAGAAVKIIANFILVSIPSINIYGAVVGSFLCNIVIDFWGLIVIKQKTGMKYDIKGLVIKPLICSVLSSLGAWGVSKLMNVVLNGVEISSFITGRNISTVIAVGFAVVIYVFALLFTRTLTKTDIKMFPKGEKIAKVLEKYRLLR